MNEANPVVLVVDDEVQIRRFLRAGLELDGFSVQDAETGADALRWATLKAPDFVILDLGLPDMDGAEVLERLRVWSSVPLIVLSVRSDEAEKVRVLESGADDYVVKPFGMAELLARAHAAMRRHVRVSTGEPVVKVGPLAIDLAARIVTINGARVMLTPKEYRLLQLLAQHAGNVVTHQFLLKEVWGVAPSARHALSAHLRAQAPAEDRGRPDPAADSVDRARGRISPGGAGDGRSGSSTTDCGRRRRTRRSMTTRRAERPMVLDIIGSVPKMATRDQSFGQRSHGFTTWHARRQARDR